MFYFISEVAEKENDIELAFRLNFFGLQVFEERKKGKEEIIKDITEILLRSSGDKKAFDGKTKDKADFLGRKFKHEAFKKVRQKIESEEISGEEISFLYRIFTFVIGQGSRKVLSLQEIKVYINMDMLMSPDIMHLLGALQSVYGNVMWISAHERFCLKVKFRIKALRSLELVLRIFLEIVRMKLRKMRM